MSTAADYSAQRISTNGVDIVRLTDSAHKIEVSIAPAAGNIAFSMRVNGKEVLYFPYAGIPELKAKPALCGIPFLWPWANRIDQDAYWVNGKKYLLNPDLGNIRYDANHKPIHGLLPFSSDWKVASVEADADSARLTSRLDFWQHPQLMAQFPFDHVVEMTYKLHGGALQVETALRNRSTEPMPVALGFHPYFQLSAAPRDQWKVHLAAKEQYVLSDVLIPTGERRPIRYSDPQPLAGVQLDDVFGSLIRGDDGRAHFWVEGGGQKISVIYGPKFQVAVVYAPPGRNFVCFEPMAAITDAFNLAHAGLYKDLQSVPPGGEWRESFWVVPSGF